MRTLFPALGAAVLAGALALPILASAQTAATPVVPAGSPPIAPPSMPGPAAPRGPMMMGSQPHPGPWAGPWMARRGHAAFAWHNTWGLFHRPADLGLSAADVQTIAEAILLRNGEHDWKVGDVTANADHTVSFAFLTAHGDVIARFTMDTETGRISRTD